MQFRQVVSKRQPEFVKDYARCFISSLFTGRFKQLRVTPPKSEIITDPLAQTEMQSDQFVFTERRDFCLLLNWHQRPEYPHCRINRLWEFVLVINHFLCNLWRQKPVERLMLFVLLENIVSVFN